MRKEKDYENKIKRLIEASGGWQVKFFANRFTRSGVPDVLACINGYFLAVEVKSDDGSPTALQLKTIKKIRDAGGFAFVLYPSGWIWFKDFLEDITADEVIKHNYMPMVIK